MADPEALRAALADNLRALSGLQVSEYQLSNPTPPSAMVEVGPIEYDRANARGTDVWTFVVTLIVSLNSDIGAQKNLDRFLAPSGDQSVKQAIEADCTLDGNADDLRVTNCTGQRIYSLDTTGGTQRASYLGAEWTVEVWAPGD